jgi:Cytochrome c554 and c-prime
MHTNDPAQVQPSSGERGAWFKLAALVLTGVTVATATGFLMTHMRPSPGQESPPGDQPSSVVSPQSQRDWPRPDLALVLTGQQHGYLQPCGCTIPQLGGLARRYNFVQSLRDRGWQVVSADLGDIAQRSGPQATLKYRVSIEALRLMNYSAVGIGENEINLPLLGALAETALQNPSPRVLAANLKNRDQQFPNMVASTQVTQAKDGAILVGFAGVVARSVSGQAQEGTGVEFDKANDVLPAVLKELQDQKAEFLVLLCQGDNREARHIAEKFPQFHVILCKSEEEQASMLPERVGNALLISVGHKGRYVGLVGIYRTGKAEQPFRLRYELVEIGPDFETPQGHDKDNPEHALLQKYAQEVKDGKYLEKYPHDARHPVQVAFPNAEYIGSEACKDCHKHAFQVWSNHPHSHAYDTLVKQAKRPNLRQFDGECVQCHVTGWSPGTADTGPGFGYKTGFTTEKQTPQLEGVGCESCHGPGSLHSQHKNNLQFREAMNPFRARPGQNPKVVAGRIDAMCQKCHDIDNSKKYDFDVYWIEKKTVHHTPKKTEKPSDQASSRTP